MQPQQPPTAIVVAPSLVVTDLPELLAAIEGARIGNDLTKQELARRAGTSAQSVSEWLSGKHEPAASRLFALVQACGLNLALVVPDSGHNVELAERR